METGRGTQHRDEERVQDVVTAADEDGTREDGRTERTRRTRAAIVEAHVALLAEGDLRPTAQRIAERSGVSVRTLWMHFPDMEAVFAATAGAILRAQVEAHRPVPVGLPLAERVERFCRQRAQLLEQITPYVTASQLREALSPTLQDYRARHVLRVVEEIEHLFADALPADPAERRELVQALTAVSTWGSWSVLRQHLGLGTTRARRVMERAVTALLASSPATDLPPTPEESA